jgi:PAS domain S-box-containing protein
MAAIHNEVRQRFGLVPNFFRLASDNPEITENLWGFARFGYLDNPLPSLFKERLFVWLSRFCKVRYCIARHAGFLLGLGHAAGDADSLPHSIDDVLHLLKRHVPRAAELRVHIERCASLRHPLAEMPVLDSDLEWSIFACATHVFLQSSAEADCLGALHRALGPSRMEHLLVLLTFVRTAHYWTEVHPELTLEDDIKQLLATHIQLSQCLLEDPEARSSEVGQRLLAELESLRQEKQQLIRESELRLQQELADSRLLHEISNELIGEQHIDALYSKIIDAAARLMRSQHSSMQMLLEDSDKGPQLQLLGHHSFTPEAAKFWEYVRIGSASSYGAALASGRRIVVMDLEQCEFMAGTEDLAMYRKLGIRAVQTTPLYSRTGKMVGAISTHWNKPYQPSEHELQMLDILARQAADLIERAKTDEALRVRDERFRRALQPQNVGVIFFNTEGGITEANDAFLQMSGYTREDVEAGRLRWDKMTPSEWMQSSLHAIEEFKTKGYTTPYEKEYIRKDGSRWCALFAGTRLAENEGVEFVIDITDRKRAEQALKDADRRKDEFLATLAHELRNPLAPISNAVQLLRRPDGRRKADQLMEMAERQVRQIVRLVDDLLEVSRITSGKIELNKVPIALADIVHSAIETSRPLIEQYRHALTVSLPEKAVMLDADSVRLTQVLANLLNNAAKYTNPSGHIWLTAHQDGGQAVITVRDNGIGIPPEQLPKIFDLFAQVGRSANRGQDGLGIGLTMVRSLVEMHGGSVEAHSAGPGQGSEFIVHLPLLKVSDTSDTTQSALADMPFLFGQRILVVDDNRDAADTLGLLLESDGAEVQVVYDGHAALSTLDAFHPQTVLLDLGMPDMNGYEVAQQMRQDQRFQDIRVVALTGWGQDTDRCQTRASGFDAHMTKPVNVDALRTWLTGA